jgi:hypothetical protein
MRISMIRQSTAIVWLLIFGLNLIYEPASGQEGGCEFLLCAPSDRPPPRNPSELPTQQRPGTYWEHNDSIVYLDAVISTGSRKFLYYRPNSRMALAGAQPGSLLFEGRRRNNRYEGTAYIFSHNCGSFPYQVSGDVINDETVIMTGNAPQVDPASCTIIGHVPDRLRFTYKYRIDG